MKTKTYTLIVIDHSTRLVFFELIEATSIEDARDIFSERLARNGFPGYVCKFFERDDPNWHLLEGHYTSPKKMDVK